MLITVLPLVYISVPMPIFTLVIKCHHLTPDILGFYPAHWIQRIPEIPLSPLDLGIQFDGSISHYHLWPRDNSHPRALQGCWSSPDEYIKGVCLDKFRGIDWSWWKGQIHANIYLFLKLRIPTFQYHGCFNFITCYFGVKDQSVIKANC